MNRDDFDPDDFEEFGPNDELPENLPPPLRQIITRLMSQGHKVRIARQVDEHGNRAGLILEGEAHRALHEIMDEMRGQFQEEHMPATPGHEPHCDCYLCETNRVLQKVNKSELTPDQKFEAAIKIVSEKADEMQKANDAKKTANLLLNAQVFQATRANRTWLINTIRERVAGLMLKVKDAPPKLESKEGEPAELTQLREHLKGTLELFVVKDAADMLERLTSTPVMLYVDEITTDDADATVGG